VTSPQRSREKHLCPISWGLELSAGVGRVFMLGGRIETYGGSLGVRWQSP
jgi:hypothetical protein